MPIHQTLSLATLAGILTLTAPAQSNRTATQFGIDRGQTPAAEINLNYIYIHANAPPSQCGCFSLNGGGGALIVNAPHGISLVADLSASHANQVAATSQNITLFNVLVGARYSYRSAHRFTPYTQALVGKSNEYANYALVQNVSALAASGGLGASLAVSRHIAWNVVQADYIYSRLPNTSNNRQSDLRLASGIVFRFGPR